MFIQSCCFIIVEESTLTTQALRLFSIFNLNSGVNHQEWHAIWRATVICHSPLLCIQGALVIKVHFQDSVWPPASLPTFFGLCCHGNKLK